MSLEKQSKSKDLMLGTALALGGLVVTETGISFFQENSTLGGEIMGASTIAIGALIAIRGTNRMFKRLLAPEHLNKNT